MTFEGNLKHFSSFCCPCPSFQQFFVVFILPDRLWYWTIGLKSVVWGYRKFNIFYMWAYLLVQIQMCVYCTSSVDHDSLLAYFIKVHFFRVSFSKYLSPVWFLCCWIENYIYVWYNNKHTFNSLKIFFKDLCMSRARLILK